MAEIGVYLIGRPTNSRTALKHFRGVLEKKGYKIGELNDFNSRDMFLKLETGRNGEAARFLDRETLLELSKAGYADNTRQYEM